MLGPDHVEQVLQLLRHQRSTYSAAISMSVLASVISTLEMKVRKKCQCSCISREHGRAAGLPGRLADPDPTPNQPGTICRDWVQPNTHGMARSPAMPPPESGRRAGREPMFSEPSCSTGVEARK